MLWGRSKTPGSGLRNGDWCCADTLTCPFSHVSDGLTRELPVGGVVVRLLLRRRSNDATWFKLFGAGSGVGVRADGAFSWCAHSNHASKRESRRADAGWRSLGS